MSKDSLSALKQTEDQDLVKEAENEIVEYAKYVLTYSQELEYKKGEIPNHGTSWYREEMMRMDRTRRNMHNVAIGSINIINKLCKIHSVPEFYPGDVTKDDRRDVGESILEYCKDRLSYLDGFA